MLNEANAGALWMAVYAFGEPISIGTLALVYLVGIAMGSAALTPGGLGAVEAALSTGLAATGMVGHQQSAQYCLRIATFCLPVPVVWAALNMLARRGTI